MRVWNICRNTNSAVASSTSMVKSVVPAPAGVKVLVNINICNRKCSINTDNWLNWYDVLYSTVQTFNSCTSHPPVSGCTDTHGQNAKKISQAHQWHTQLANQSYVQFWGHPCPGNWVAIRCAVMYNAWPSHAPSAGMKCQHCRSGWFSTYEFDVLAFIRIFQILFCRSLSHVIGIL